MSARDFLDGCEKTLAFRDWHIDLPWFQGVHDLIACEVVLVSFIRPIYAGV